MRRTRRNYLIRIIIIVAITAAIIVTAAVLRPSPDDTIADGRLQESYDLTLWYYDSSFDDYVVKLKENYFKSTGLRLDCKNVSAVEFFSKINQMNVDGDKDRPDLFITECTRLEQAYLGSVAKEITDDTCNLANFADTALKAVTYKGKKVAYPLAFDIAFLAYNKDFQLEEPKSFESIAAQSKAFIKDERSSIDMIALIDPNSLISNYGFIGNYLNIGGETGDNIGEIDINNEQLLSALNFYKQFSSDLNIDQNTVTYDLVENSFVFSRCTTAIITCKTIGALNAANTNYAISSSLPVNDTLESKPLSTTWCVCINPLSDNIKNAQALARYMSFDDIDFIYDTTSLMSCKRILYSEKGFQNAYTQYENSAQLPKMIETEEIWKDIKTMLNSIWGGEDVQTALNKFNESVNKSLNKHNSTKNK